MSAITYKAYEVFDFPFDGGVYQSRSAPAMVKVKRRSALPMMRKAHIIQNEVKLGRTVLVKGAWITCRINYQLHNITQDYRAAFELIGVEAKKDETMFFVNINTPLQIGDHIKVSFLGVDCH